MDSQAQTSFIPKKPIVSSVTSSSHSGFLWVIAIFIFFIAIGGAVGAYLYQSYLTSHITDQSNQLAQAKAAYNQDAIADLLRLDLRINQSKGLLNAHLNPSAIFTFLQENTLATIRFDNFSYAKDATGAVLLTLHGQALDFSSVALQSDAFGKNKSLKNVLFSNVDIDQLTGHIGFNVSANLDPTIILFKNSINADVSSKPSLPSVAPVGSTTTSAPSGVSASTTPVAPSTATSTKKK